ncbi:MAG: hypothetical protein HOQ17_01785 [Gemmatimonadaceae bacterium]|nr:hypothetical protein [Gemmatimonadaceae bacterium]NUP69930.1 hypothetical protein [Gemmatimonadaceae bacterium]NUR32426.1 hypothetical protein [Gemmatimonadaceae bacterium]NUS31762.1 hypothetical protein [Gemmatimonadaceae bacterium]
MSSALHRGGLLAVALVAVVATACNETPSAPAPAGPAPALAVPVDGAPAHDLLGGLVGGTVGALTNTLGLTSANGILRNTPLPYPITVSKTIGRAGGVLSIPAAGVSVVVPVGALSGDTKITMTARAGSLLAYDFEPHGVQFNVPLVFNQDLNGTNAGLLSPLGLKLGYYSDPSLLGTTTALVSELITGVTNLLSRTFTAPIKHFSGYVVICGRSDE